MKTTSLHNQYLNDSPFYAALHAIHGEYMPDTRAGSIARDHGASLSQAPDEVFATDVSGQYRQRMFVDTLQFVMWLGY